MEIERMVLVDTYRVDREQSPPQKTKTDIYKCV